MRVLKDNNKYKGAIVALSEIDIVRLRIADTASSPFYPLLSDEDIEYCLEANYGNITAAVQLAATCAYGQVSKIPIRERVGDVEVWNNVSKAYKDFLDIIIKSSTGGAAALAYLAKPYSAGISWTDLLANYGNPDVIKSSLALLETGYYNEQEGYI